MTAESTKWLELAGAVLARRCALRAPGARRCALRGPGARRCALRGPGARRWALRAPGGCALRGLGLDRDAPAVLAHALVLDVSGDQSKEGVVATDADSGTCRDLRAALPNQDRARVDGLPAVDLDAQHLRIRVAAVARPASGFLVV